jgi:hypothetical protein
MIKEGAWFERKWSFELPVSAFPAVLERLRGTSARMAELIVGATDDRLRWHPAESWSAKRHLGHLDDLHELDDRRLREYLSGATTLSAADRTNRLTYETDHDAMPAEAIVARFRTHRDELVAEMDRLTESQIAATAMHPRLGRPMRLIDWAYFVAEHDDHHLAAARQALTKSVLASA